MVELTNARDIHGKSLVEDCIRTMQLLPAVPTARELDKANCILSHEEVEPEVYNYIMEEQDAKA